MTLTTAPHPFAADDNESDKSYYANLWGTTGRRRRDRETWAGLRTASVRLALAGAAILLAYATLSSALA